MTNDKQRERLVEIASGVVVDIFAKKIANEIIKDGWIRPPLGDKVYIVAEVSRQIVECTVIGVWIYENDCMIITDCGTIHNLSIGKTVFFTKEEAEETLKGGVQG